MKCLICGDFYFTGNASTGEPEEKCLCGYMWSGFYGGIWTFVKEEGLRGMCVVCISKTLSASYKICDYLTGLLYSMRLEDK